MTFGGCHRLIPLVIAACALAACSSGSDQASTSPSASATADAHLDLVFAQVDQAEGGTEPSGQLDFTSVDDAELTAAGEAFCRELSGPGDGTSAGIGPTTDDFSRVAEQEIGPRFLSEANRDATGRPVTNGPTVLAYAVGTAAVRAMCPEFESALG